MDALNTTEGDTNAPNRAHLAARIKGWAFELGFTGVGITDTALGMHPQWLRQWLARGRHGDMAYMARHATLRADPTALRPGTLRIVSVRMDYLPESQVSPVEVLDNPYLGYVSRYAVGRDYHKVLRNRLQKLADRLTEAIGPFGYRVYCDSAPVLEKAIAHKAGLGWIGKHTNLLHRGEGSWFFLAELFTDIDLPIDAPSDNHCGSCTACIDICPTQAIVGPYELDARRCIAYLTIEHAGTIPVALRPALGNRIYGCDDCQLICPWNRYARVSPLPDFALRDGLEAPQLEALLRWSDETFRARTEGSAIRRIGHSRWLRNVAIALGNGPATPGAIAALQARMSHPDELVREHVRWALLRLHEASPH